MRYEAKTFSIPETPGISKETMENHIKLYEGYVKHVNLIRDEIAKERDAGEDTYALAEMQRRLGFEFGGMRNHEYYFTQFEGGAKNLPDGKLKDLIEKQWGTYDAWLSRFKQIAGTRGVGWAMLYHDTKTDQLVQTWVDEQQLGQLADLDIILALDMWEHSYMHDYLSSDKGKYIEAFFKNLNWEISTDRIS